MSIKSYFQGFAEARKAKAEALRLTKANLALRAQNVQFSSKILSLETVDNIYKGNNYQNYSEAVDEIKRKYTGVADWGVLQTGAIIDLRASFIIADGVKVEAMRGFEMAGKETLRELEFAKAFLAYNGLDAENAQEFAKEAEMEGKMLVKLFWVDENKMVAARFMPWKDKKYVVTSDKQDYLKYTKVTFTPPGEAEQVIEPANFVYKKFGGVIAEPNSAAPKIMKCLTQVESIDKALRDWREINRIYASPIPDMEYEDRQKAAQASEDFAEGVNWKIKKMFFHTGKFKYVQPDATNVEMLAREIETNAKMISGTTGVPVHFLGYPDLMSNRATAENLMELILAQTNKERIIWTGAYKEMLEKAAAIYNEKTGLGQMSTKLDMRKVRVYIPLITREQWERLEKVFVPLSIAGKISDEMMLSQIPGVDIKEEKERREAEDGLKKHATGEDFDIEEA